MNVSSRYMIGSVFGRLTVLENAGYVSETGKNLYWLCECTCGNKLIIRGDRLRSGEALSCGCGDNSKDNLNWEGLLDKAIDDAKEGILWIPFD